MKTACIIISLMLLPGLAYCQQTQEEKIRENELQRQAQDQRELNMQLDSAVHASDMGYYSLADEKFRMLLRRMRSIPSNLVFYFGKNSFHLEKYKQSVDWLNKYIQLKGTTGQYSQEALVWLKKSEAALMQQKQTQVKQAAQILSHDYNIDCGPTGKVTCPVCNGTTVIIKRNYLGENYSTCPYCSRLGYLHCEDYNKLLRGELEPNNTN